MTTTGSRIGGIALAVSLLLGVGRADAKEDDPNAAFFAAFEQGDPKAAAALPDATLADASPYDTKQEKLPPAQRDGELYYEMIGRVESGTAGSAAAKAKAAIHFDLGVIALRQGDLERARRKLLLAVVLDPQYRMAHLWLSRVYARLEQKVMEEAGDRPLGEVLYEKIGVGSADEHIGLAQKIVDGFPEATPAVTVSFHLDHGKPSALKVERGTASANAKMMRPRSHAPEPGHLTVAILGPDQTRIDEAPVNPVQTLYDAQGIGTTQRDEVFDTFVELLATPAGGRVVVFDPEGKKLAEVAVPAAAPSK